MGTCRSVRRYLILAASMGDGHLQAAEQLRQRLVGRGDEADVVDILQVLPFEVGPLLRKSYAAMLRHAPFLYDAIYRAFFAPPARVRARTDPLVAASSPAVRRLIAERQPDVVISTFHLCGQITGRLRMSGQLSMPSLVVVTDFVAHRRWLHPGNDAFICVHQSVADDVKRRTGRPSFVAAPPISPRFLSDDALPRTTWRKELRAEIGADLDRPVVLVSAGAWGSGGVIDAVRAIASPRHTTLVLCGRNGRLHDALSAMGTGVVALGWRDDMPRLMRASDVLVENAAGQTAMEALAAGLPVLSYRPLPGHGRAGVLRMARLGLSSFASDDVTLQQLITEFSRPGSPSATRQIQRGRALFTADPAVFLGLVATRA